MIIKIKVQTLPALDFDGTEINVTRVTVRANGKTSTRAGSDKNKVVRDALLELYNYIKD